MLQGPFTVIQGLHCLQSVYQTDIDGQEYAIQPGIGMQALIPALLLVGPGVAVVTDPEVLEKTLLDFLQPLAVPPDS